MLKFVFLSVLLLAGGVKGQDDEFLYDVFPPDFQWGVATSAYQIEGGAFADGKGLSNWDYWSHNGSYEGHCNVRDCQNGDVGGDSYHKFREDAALIKSMGADFYRFSLSWARIVPTGRVADGVNQAGIDHYNEVIDNLIAEGITPFITLYHWDLPLPLTWDGSWLNEDIIEHFKDYARIVFENYGDRVKLWLSFNEPHVFCFADWTYAYLNPFNWTQPVKPYICSHNILKAHALAWRMYDSEFRPTQGGKMGITLNCDWPEPLDPANSAHVEASDRSMHFHYGLYANPLLRGEYPPIMRSLIDAKSEAEGRNESRLPSFDAEWTQIVNDFLGLNHYFAYKVVPDDNNESIWVEGDANIHIEPDDESWNHTAVGWPITPFGIRKVVKWIADEYNYPIYITENGYGHWENDTFNDPIRVEFYKQYINNVLRAVRLDGADVKSYTAWSLLDNYEWASGYSVRFGVHHVNYTDPNLTRTPKASAMYLKVVFADNGFPNATRTD
ncbi:lactase-phlorizin hydrolase isoform X2 [Folsomia candida]|uniref:lactase-phlorizin hydrolase isoform X2 n=1 Tax=Folsomia candida TaxID=158441 RepID=UPI000B8FFB8F|nr:lactase-phlorizin hydrolase isoform X2 [Folsomia candida]